MEDATNYLKFYDDESYLFEEVGPRFRKTGVLDAADFYMMLIWKANRAKVRQRERLKELVKGTFGDAVGGIAVSIYTADSHAERLRRLINEWGFYLATASAILTILYPEDFTVYDYRVVAELQFGKELAQRNFSDALWAKYEEYRQRVRDAAPSGLSLRDCDRFLTGRSFRQEVERDCGK